MIEIVEFEDFNKEKITPENTTISDDSTDNKLSENGNYVIFAVVDMKTEEVDWMDIVKPIIDPLEYKDELNKDVLDDFVSSLSYAYIDKEFPIINYSEHMIYAYKKHMDEEAFLKRFKWYFEENYLYRKPLTQQQKEFYQSLLLTVDNKCKEIKQFGEELLGYSLNILFYDDCYWMVGTKENEIMDFRFWKLGLTLEDAKEYLVETYLHRKYVGKDIPHQYTNGLNEAYHHYSLFNDTVNSLCKKLKLDYKEMGAFYDDIYSDFRCDGGINTDSILQGYWTSMMVKQELKKYKSSGKISKK